MNKNKGESIKITIFPKEPLVQDLHKRANEIAKLKNDLASTQKIVERQKAELEKIQKDKQHLEEEIQEAAVIMKLQYNVNKRMENDQNRLKRELALEKTKRNESQEKLEKIKASLQELNTECSTIICLVNSSNGSTTDSTLTSSDTAFNQLPNNFTRLQEDLNLLSAKVQNKMDEQFEELREIKSQTAKNNDIAAKLNTLLTGRKRRADSTAVRLAQSPVDYEIEIEDIMHVEPQAQAKKAKTSASSQSWASALTQHQQNAHSNPIRSPSPQKNLIKCNHCGYEFTEEQLKNHRGYCDSLGESDVKQESEEYFEWEHEESDEDVDGPVIASTTSLRPQ